MNNPARNIHIDKKELSIIAAYYFVLLLIAMSWTERTMVEPKTIFRILFTLFFILPLFKYRQLSPAILAVFLTIRLFSVAPYGYLPSDRSYSFYLVVIIFFFEIFSKNSAGWSNFLFKGVSKGIIGLFFISLLSNLINLNSDFSFFYLLGSTLMFTRLVKSRFEINAIEIAFIIITLCLSIYAIIFSNDFVIKDQYKKDLIQRSYWTDPNYLGCVLSIGIIISFYYYMNRVADKLILRISYLAISIMGYIVLGILASRGAFVAAIVPTAYILYKKMNSVKNFAFVILFVGAAIVAIWSSGYFDSLFARFESGDTTGSSRTVFWEASMNKYLKSDMPMIVIGGGTNYANEFVGKSIGAKSTSPHNNFLAVLYDYGIIGLILFLIMFYSWISRCSHNVLALSLVAFFGLACMTLVPTTDYPYCFLFVLLESYFAFAGPGTVKGKNRSYVSTNQRQTLNSNLALKNRTF